MVQKLFLYPWLYSDIYLLNLLVNANDLYFVSVGRKSHHAEWIFPTKLAAVAG